MQTHTHTHANTQRHTKTHTDAHTNTHTHTPTHSGFDDSKKLSEETRERMFRDIKACDFLGWNVIVLRYSERDRERECVCVCVHPYT